MRDRTTRGYDASGNATVGLQETEGEITGGATGITRHSRSHSYFSADERLRYYQENVLSLEGSAVVQQGVWEEYRYDPLGRRVMVRSNRDDLCDDSGVGQCVSHLTRYVWSGDQLLWKLRLNTDGAENLETQYSGGAYHGAVSYFHAGGIDRPLVIWKQGQATIIPHENWRGQFARGTYTSGAPGDCATSTQTTGCTPINWPGRSTTAWHAEAGAPPEIRTWYGSLTEPDGSGKPVHAQPLLRPRHRRQIQ